MRIIDLLNKIANGEEVHAKHKLIEVKYYRENDFAISYRTGNQITFKDLIRILNDEIEIIEEENKIPEKLIPTSLKGIDNLDEKIKIAHIDTISVIGTVNEIIDYLNSKEE